MRAGPRCGDDPTRGGDIFAPPRHESLQKVQPVRTLLTYAGLVGLIP